MNILHVRYAIEIAKTGSINKAAENLYMNQPNLSRAIRELEASLGIAIFERSAKGMVLTEQGSEFIGYAEKVVMQIDKLENIYKNGRPRIERFSVSVPHSSYISKAFASFSSKLDTDVSLRISFDETDAACAIHNLVYGGFDLAVLRYACQHDKYVKEMLTDKALKWETVAELDGILLMSKSCSLSEKDEVSYSDLASLVEVVHSDAYEPKNVKNTENEFAGDKRISVASLGAGIDIVSSCSESFMWACPQPRDVLEAYGLVQKKCRDVDTSFKDILVYKNGYKFSRLDNIFITELCESKRKYLPSL